MHTLWTSELPAREEERDALLDRDDERSRLYAYGGADEENAVMFMGGWPDSGRIFAFASAVQAEALFGAGSTLNYVAIYDRDGEQVAEVRS